jgi:hypothetical protein
VEDDSHGGQASCVSFKRSTKPHVLPVGVIRRVSAFALGESSAASTLALRGPVESCIKIARAPKNEAVVASMQAKAIGHETMDPQWAAPAITECHDEPVQGLPRSIGRSGLLNDGKILERGLLTLPQSGAPTGLRYAPMPR